MTTLDALWALVSVIPPGRCATYGDLGRAMPNPVSGYLVGRWMASCPEEVPWWRVVARDGRLPVWKRDPAFATRQRVLLEREGVPFSGDVVDIAACRHVPEPLG